MVEIGKGATVHVIQVLLKQGHSKQYGQDHAQVH